MKGLQQPIDAIFNQLILALNQLSKEDYTSSQAVLGNSTIGQHTRHIIELFQEVEDGYLTGRVNYDNRKRDLLLETNSDNAIHALQAVSARITKPDKNLEVFGNYSIEEDDSFGVASSYYRELIYNLEHAIHHMAYIRIGIHNLGTIQLPNDFGVAPATNRYRKACAQ